MNTMLNIIIIIGLGFGVVLGYTFGRYFGERRLLRIINRFFQVSLEEQHRLIDHFDEWSQQDPETSTARFMAELKLYEYQHRHKA